MIYMELIEKIRTANLVLVGLGENLTGDMEHFYKSLSVLLKGKDYFVVTLKERAGLEQAGILPDRGSFGRYKGHRQLGAISALAWVYAESEALYSGTGSWFCPSFRDPFSF